MSGEISKCITILIFIGSIICCKNGEKALSLNEEVASLSTDEEKRHFLEAIYDLDQEVRKKGDSIEVKYGYDSEELKKYAREAYKSNMLNLQKIELYLEKFGHPTIKEHGEKAAGTPCLVIHHTGDIETRTKYFTYLYNAYKNGDIEPGSFSFYLERFHRFKFGERFTLPNPYKEKDLINELIRRLELDTLIIKK